MVQQRKGMKTTITLLLVLVLGAVFLVACDAGEEETPVPDDEVGAVDEDADLTDDDTVDTPADDVTDDDGVDDAVTDDDTVTDTDLDTGDDESDDVDDATADDADIEDDELFEQYDADDNDVIDEDEFNTFVDENQDIPADVAFDDYDDDNNAGLGEAEFDTLASEYGITAGAATTNGEAAADAETAVTTPGMVQVENLLGITFASQDGTEMGTLTNFLHDASGKIVYMTFDTLDGQAVAIQGNALQANFEDSDRSNWTLIFTEEATDLPASYGYDAGAFNDDTYADPAELEAAGLETTGTEEDRLFWASSFTDYNLVNDQDEDLGEIEQMLVDTSNWSISYGIVDASGFLGVSEKQVPIPWNVFNYNVANDAWVLPVDQTVLENAPEINLASEVDATSVSQSIDEAGIDSYWEGRASAMDEASADSSETADATTSTMNGFVQSDNVLDSDILSATGEDIGTVSDVLIDTEGGIQYLIVDSELGEEPTVALDYSLLTAESMTGTNETMTQTVSLLFTGEDITTEPEIDTAILDQEGATIAPADLNLEAEFDNLIQVSEFDLDLVTEAGEDVGEVEEVLLNLQDGQVAYAISDIGGFLELSENTIAIPWERLQWNAAEQNFLVNADRTALENAPTIDTAQLDDGVTMDEGLRSEIANYWDDEAAPTS
jgi:sporulation protein YlmC with PRC-barrel domain